MSVRIQTSSARVTLANLTPAAKSQHKVCQPFKMLTTVGLMHLLTSKNASEEVKAQVMEGPLDAVTTARNRDLGLA